MKEAFEIVKLLAALLPIVYDLVKKLDELGGAQGTGPEKLAIVLDVIRGAFSQIKDTGIKWDQIEPLIKRAVEGFLVIIRR